MSEMPLKLPATLLKRTRLRDEIALRLKASLAEGVARGSSRAQIYRAGLGSTLQPVNLAAPEKRARMLTTEAWVLYQGTKVKGANQIEPGILVNEPYSFTDVTEHELLAEPIYGCWEANMSHALEREPVDVCRQRREKKIVLGNAGVVRIAHTGAAVTTVREGDLCLLFPNGAQDQYGYLTKIMGYDAPNSMGLLAKQVKLHEKQVIPLPVNSKHSLQQWAAFSLRYVSAWANWKMAYGCWRLQMSEDDVPVPVVWGWGGGVALAELSLAKIYGCRVAMIASDSKRLALIEEMGMTPIDRRQFADLDYDEARYHADHDYKKRYLKAEASFLNIVREQTSGFGVSIFLDNIGTPVFRATLKALAPQGVIATTGWKRGMNLSLNRAVECMRRHTHAHTHGCRVSQVKTAMCFAEETGWLPPMNGELYSWDNIPQLAQDYAKGKISTYFPLYQVNQL